MTLNKESQQSKLFSTNILQIWDKENLDRQYSPRLTQY